MQAKKSVISYGFFIVFSALVASGLWIMVNQLTDETGIFQVPGLPAAYRFVFPILITAVGMLFMILIFALFRAFIHVGQTAPGWLKILLPVLVILGAVAAITVYILHHIPIVIYDGTYFYAAQVTSDRVSLSFEPHGLSFIYLYLLRFLFLIFGNDPLVGIVFQLVLYFGILMISYIAVHTISGFGPALLTMAALAFYPGTYAEIFRITPHVFGLFVHILGIAVVGILFSYYKKNEIDGFFRAFPALFAGFYIAFATYLDLINVLLLFWCLMLLADPDQVGNRHKAVYCILQELIGFVLGACVVAAFLYAAGHDLYGYVTELGSLYFGAPHLSFGISGFESLRYAVLALVLITLCIWTACGFLVQKFDRMGHYFFSLIVVTLSIVFSCCVLDQQQLIKFYLILLAAMGVCALVYRDPEAEEEAKEQEEEIVRDIEEIEAEAEAEEEAAVEETAESETVEAAKPDDERTDEPAEEAAESEPVAEVDVQPATKETKPEDVTFRIVGTDTEGYELSEATPASDAEPAPDAEPEPAVEKEPTAESERVVVPTAEPVVRPGAPLANPLPVPKKKPRKVLNFGKEIPEEMMHFDIEVSDFDDYDFD